MEIRISHDGLDITISHKPNNEESINKKRAKTPSDDNSSELIPGIPNPLKQRDKKIMDETWEYLEHLAERGLI
jgi:diketogulonate reductase-like aldo/keto reductase